MPVTAKLSQRFSQIFGDEIANELVEWFNSMDPTYRSDPREVNQPTGPRFDARLEQRLAGLRQELAQGLAAAGQDRSRVEARLTHEIAALRQDTTQAITALRAEIYTNRCRTDSGFESFRAELANQRAGLISWMVLFWVPTGLALIGLYLKR